ncbi:hypothetical protein [Clostridium sp.]|uniref:hypothetical protein n=1 Tax=Clostridium sp. TaxID=1506 RepID=UPI003217280D
MAKTELKSTKKIVADKPENNNEEIIQEKTIAKEEAVKTPVAEVEIQPEVKKPKKFEPTALIPCTNIFAGTTVMIGQKSGIMYTWLELGQTEDVEYQDVIAEILKKSSSYIYEPLIVIEDKELLEQRPDLKKFYDKMYSPVELKHILNMSSPESMRNVIINLPKGVKETVKNLAATMIQEGTLDSVKKIKIIDELFDTKLMMQTELYLK